MQFLHAAGYTILFIILLLLEDKLISFNNKKRQIELDLWYALSGNKIEEVKELLKKGASPNYYMDLHYQHVLCAAIASKNIQLIDLMIEKGSLLHANNDQALERASYTDNIEIFNHVYSKGFDIRAFNDKILMSALHRYGLGTVSLEMILYICNLYEDQNVILEKLKFWSYEEIKHHIHNEILHKELSNDLKKSNVIIRKSKI